METHNTQHTVDVSGLPPEAVFAVEALVGMLREKAASPGASVFDLFGKAAQLRTAVDIARQTQDERSGWGEA